jgi:hypothetical protein
MKERLSAIAAGVRALVSRFSGAVIVIASIAIVGLIGFVAIKAISGGEEEEPGRETNVANVDHSWIAGQASLVSYPEYGPIAGVAADLGDTRYEALQDALAEIERQRILAAKREQRRLERQLRRERREAKREYREALREAARERRRQERLIAEKKARIKARIERLREKYEVPPGRECEIPVVADTFNCKTGKPDF